MSLAFVQKTPNTTAPSQGSGTSKITPAFGSSVSEGNLIVAGVSFVDLGGGSPNVTFSDSKGNTWYVDKQIKYEGGVTLGIAIGHCIVGSGKGGTGFTVTATLSVSCDDIELGACEYSGADPSLGSGGSGSNGGTGYGTAVSSGLVDVGAGNFLFFGIAGWYTIATGTEGSGWTERHYQACDASHLGYSSEEKIASGDQTAPWTLSTSAYWAAACVAFKEAAAGPTYEEDLTSIGISASSIQDIQKFIQVLDSVIQSQSTLADLQNYLQTLDSLIQSQSTLADLQTYKETLESLIQSVSSESDTKSLVEDLQSTIASISALTDIQNYVHMLDSVAQSAVSLSDIQNYIDIVMSTAQSISSIDDFKTYMEILDSIATSVSTISDTIVLAEALETLIQSEATLIDIQHYFETLLTTIISEASVIDVLSGQYVEELLSVIISEAGVYDYYQKPGMIETTPPFYLPSKKEFQFGKAIESFYTGGPIPQFIIKEAEGFYMGKSVPQFIVEKRYGATA